ncbi:Glyoxalase/bleomycin resistance protein/dioxygenase [Neobacillus bataviensis LMG 21833]|uniref:Glyoxalase/bleomycin resistance protein/dioxygenase n=1 Tax=Neobacillus bataviensis LMG 21833 TaxID=1117379 RepID=K6DR96_9BACI|nr:VOC family protein [Neobacillus bataviensis]EKN70738.1 Glyoxalase/bleomycin resistance protein/dioxygenase [Neobacillus bataviensis LMG 21833]
MSFVIKKIDHVQLAAPKSCEDTAREFFAGVLGLIEVEKPEELKKRGGVWFEFGTFQLHIGVEEPFSPAKKAHPGFVVENIEELITVLRKKNVAYTTDNNLPGASRIHVHDPFGNRLEFLEWI